MFLLIKRGLYWRPDAKGYTGLKDQAGRYTLEECAGYFPNVDSPNQDGTTFIAEADAPDYSPSCCEWVKRDHMTQKAQAEADFWRGAVASANHQRDEALSAAQVADAKYGGMIDGAEIRALKSEATA